MEMTSHGWRFRLQGDVADLEQMATLFETGPIRVTREDGEFWMQSAEIDSVADHSEAQEAAESALKTLNGVSLFRVENTGRVSLDGDAEHFEASGQLKKYVSPSGVQLTTRTGIMGVLINGKPVPPQENPMLTVALRTPHVDQVLRLYGARELDWRDLYFILEVIETDIGTTVDEKGTAKAEGKAWTSDDTRELFRHTANNKGAIGDLARHGTDEEPPKHPLPLPEARLLIRGLVDRWVHEAA